MTGPIIVCGIGDVGYQVVELLHRLGEPVVVVAERIDEERRLALEDRKIPILLGNARNERLLLETGLESAQALITVTDKDLVNIEIALDARRLRPDLPIVLRLFDQDLARQVESALDVRRALGMSALAAPSFAAAAMGDSVLASFTLGGIPFVVGRKLVGDSRLGRCPNAAAVSRFFRLQTLLRERPGEGCAFLPGGGEPLQPGDRLSLLGRKKDWDRCFGTAETPADPSERSSWRHSLANRLRRAVRTWNEEPLPLRILFASICLLIPAAVLFFRYFLGFTLTDAIFYTTITLHGEIGLTDTLPEVKLYEVLVMILGSVTVATLYSMITDYVVSSRLRKILGGRPMPKRGHVLVVGMGHVGFRTLRELTRLGVPAVAIDVNPDTALLANARTLAPVVTGDARSGELLAQAGLATATAVVAATSDDAVNLSVALTARRLNPRIRTVLRLFDDEFARKVESALGIDSALGASWIAAPTFAASVLYPDVARAVIVQDQLLVFLERKAGDWAGLKPSELRAEQGIHVLLRGGEPVAADEKPLEAGEEILAALCRSLAPDWAER
ncbi:MAG TPA: NAD(P)-binding protein [Thermoanaerobaculia bacterium]|nr:NAD(P)-binding protein [Thermoanaerobaculia bacterium]